MKDSVSLLRHKIQDRSLAFQDATMNAVITLAAIEVNANLRVSLLLADLLELPARKGKSSREQNAYRWSQAYGRCSRWAL